VSKQQIAHHADDDESEDGKTAKGGKVAHHFLQPWGSQKVVHVGGVAEQSQDSVVEGLDLAFDHLVGNLKEPPHQTSCDAERAQNCPFKLGCPVERPAIFVGFHNHGIGTLGPVARSLPVRRGTEGSCFFLPGDNLVQTARCYVVFNANAGTALAMGLTSDDLRSRLVEHGLEPVIDDREGVGLDERIADAIASDADILVAAGGDGTITALANALVGTGRRLGILPLGTVNALAKDLNIPLDIDQAIDVLAAQTDLVIDVGEVSGQYFLHKVVIGLIPELAAGREHIRKQDSLAARMAFLRYMFRRIARARRFAVTIDLGDGRAWAQRVQAVAVASNSYSQGLGRMFSRDRLDAGKLTLYVLKHLTIRDFFRLSVEMMMGRWQEDEALDITEANEVTINARREMVKVMFDGEVMSMPTPLHFRIHPAALRVLAPEPQETAADMDASNGERVQ
jgi:YegS/Rv2252/BmrU family lipid kinase